MPASPPAGWHPDPSGRHDQRYWDGVRWTEHVASAGHLTIDPLAATPVLPAVAGRVLPDWYPDPSGRHEQRYWDGAQWTEHVVTAGRAMVDPLTAENAGGTANRRNRKIERQARNAGANGSRVGGGTLLTEPVVVVSQRVKRFGFTTGQGVYDQHGHQLGVVEEVNDRPGDHTRTQIDRVRDRRLHVVDMNHRVVLVLIRPEVSFNLKSKMLVEAPDGTPLGSICQETLGVAGALATTAQYLLSDVGSMAGKVVRFGVKSKVVESVGKTAGKAVGKVAGWAAGGVAGTTASTVAEMSGVPSLVRFGVRDLDDFGLVRFGIEAAGRRLGTIRAESNDQLDFRVQDTEGHEIGRISETWAGWGRDSSAKPENYVVQIYDRLDEPLHSLVIAAALALDLALESGD